MAEETKTNTKKEKTVEDRIKEIYKMAKGHFGNVRFVGVKYHKKIGWIAKVQFDGDFENLTADGKDVTEALKKLKKRVSKIIDRYNKV
jgi:hypothetical protein